MVAGEKQQWKNWFDLRPEDLSIHFIDNWEYVNHHQKDGLLFLSENYLLGHYDKDFDEGSELLFLLSGDQLDQFLEGLDSSLDSLLWLFVDPSNKLLKIVRYLNSLLLGIQLALVVFLL